MGLRDLNFKEDYRTGYDDFLQEFLRPALDEATQYWRAVGFFSSSSLEAFGTPLGKFVKRGGTIRLVSSVQLSEQDIEAIERGANKEQMCEERILELIDEQFVDGIGDGVARLGLLIEMNRLEIKIAIPRGRTGLYHEKIGLFFDADDFVAFTGSSNESDNAYFNNRECVDVYGSWDSPKRAQRKREHFEELWNNNDIGVDVYSFPEAARKKLLKFVEERETEGSRPKKESNKWRHQDEAMSMFIAAERGVLNMATGTGKTRTALKILTSLFTSNDIDTVIVTTGGNDLLDQWYGEVLGVRKELGRPVRLYRDYGSSKEVQEFALTPKNGILLVSRESGVARDPIASALRNLTTEQARRTLLVHDEVHNLGSPGNRQRLNHLSDNVRYRLGLSATPDREYDSLGNQFIENHIGPELFRFELSDAIKRGILAPFDYFPLPYNLTEDDRERLRNVYSMQAARKLAGNPMREEEVWIEIARVYKSSLGKLPVFDRFVSDHTDLLRRCIVFVETQEYGGKVLEIIHKYRHDFHTYFSGEESNTLKRFARSDIECLITCHRVSEGIDIQSLNSVVLFSSARARLETIQRMGRCLRTDPENPSKIASVVDFIRNSDKEGEPNADDERCSWLRELSKVRREDD